MNIPEWVKDSIFYQIFPDRFANGDQANDPPNVQQWGSPPDPIHFQGGDLTGIEQKLDYLQDLGVNAIYLNPIFLSPSTHRYNTVDYYRIDPKLGTPDDFRRLLKKVHQRGMRLILDGVFNHCGRGFFAFNDLLENGKNSPYVDWFYIHGFPLNAYSRGKATRYEAWWGFKSLPKFNVHHPAVRKYIFEVARYWVEEGIDGWRLDVPNEIDDDEFWEEFRHVVKSVNPSAYLVGEIWDLMPRWVNDTHFDGVMHYPLRSAILDVLSGKTGINDFYARLLQIEQTYGQDDLFGMYLLLGSHDTERVKTLLNGDAQKLHLAYLLMFAFPGAPSIYYGDEVGLEGGRDPDCRGAFPWDESKWNLELRQWIQKLIEVRKATPLLRRGKWRLLEPAFCDGVVRMVREGGGDQLFIMANLNSEPCRITIPAGSNNPAPQQIPQDLIGGQFTVEKNHQQFEIVLPGMSGGYFSTSFS
ncbi:MAG: alpha-amylase [Bellilinea sp.]|nr:MAG: alpha-amylase [Bellilinea sp.]